MPSQKAAECRFETVYHGFGERSLVIVVMFSMRHNFFGFAPIARAFKTPMI